MFHVGLLIGTACRSVGVILLLILIVCVYHACHQVWQPKKKKLENSGDVNDISMYRVG